MNIDGAKTGLDSSVISPELDLDLIEVLESRISRSRNIGIVRWRWQLTTQRNESFSILVAVSLFELKSL